MKFQRNKGFSLIELMVAVVIVGILAAIAVPSYQSHIIKASRAAAQTELLELANIQEKIYLNSNAYTPNMTTAYNGTSAGGLGKTTGLTTDGKYTLAFTGVPGQTYTITATPVAGKSQEGDGNITISENGQRLWGTTAW
jgi:type IV pilus assembly protein PilE